MNMEIKIDPEFQNLIPPLVDEQFRQLEENLLKDKRCFDPLLTWNSILLDGHNRLEICTRHGIPLETAEVDGIECREDAIIWICQHQRGRRNATQEQLDYMLGKEYEATKKRQGGDRKSSHQSDDLIGGRTAARVADAHNVGQSTVERSGNFAKAVDRIGEVTPGAKAKILSGQAGVSRAEVRKLAKMDDAEIEAVARQIESGEYKRPEPIPAPPSETAPAPNPRAEREQIKQYVAELKEDSSDAITPDMLLATHEDFVERSLLTFGHYEEPMYRGAYDDMNDEEKEKMIALNNRLLGAIKKNNLHLKG